MTLKKIKSLIKILIVNALVLYIFSLIANQFLNEKNITSDNLIINIKRFDKNFLYKGEVSKEYLKNVDGNINKKFELATGELGNINVENISFNNTRKIDYLFMGGSTTECLYVSTQNRFPYLINKSLHDSILVINLSKSGKNSHQSFLQLNTQLNDLHINNLILMHNINDLTQLLYFDSYIKGALIRKSVIEYDDIINYNKPFYIPYNLLNKVKDVLRQALPDIYDNLKKARFLGFLKENDDFEEYRTKSIDQNIFKQFKNNLKLIASLCKIRDINLILMTQFNRFEYDDDFIRKTYEILPNTIDYDKFVNTYKVFNNIIREVAKENNLTLVDLDLLIPKNKEFIYDAVHLTDKGSVLVANEILNEINL